MAPRYGSRKFEAYGLRRRVGTTARSTVEALRQYIARGDVGLGGIFYLGGRALGGIFPQEDA